MSSTPQRKTIKLLQEQGYSIHTVEKWIPVAGDWKRGKRVDAWGFGDLLACRAPRPGIAGVVMLVQCCARSGHANHKKKILAIPEFHIWKKAGGRVALISWGKLKAPVHGDYWAMRMEEL